MTSIQQVVARRGSQGTSRALVQGAIGCAVFGLLINTWLVEGLIAPVVVASGSMAPALTGPHVEWTCGGCGRQFVCGTESMPPVRRAAVCPFCRAENATSRGIERSGSRVLVDRCAFLFHAPCRFDMVVLHSPDDLQQLCVKRVVGLPGEQVRIAEGEVWASGSIVRKTIEQQREMAVAISSAPTQWQDPSDHWRWDGTRFVHTRVRRESEVHWLSYRHTKDTILDESPYDQSESRVLNPVSDMMLRGEITTGSRGELLLAASAGGDSFVARLCIDSKRGALEHNGRSVATIDASSISLDRPTRLEWARADRQVRLALDDCVLMEYCYHPAACTGGSAASVALGARGADVELSDPQVLRDVYYTPAGLDGSDSWQLGPDEYFLLGDNSAHSADSRSWSRARGVSAMLIVGKAIRW